MTYLRRLIQRLTANTPPNMLLPNSNGWGGMIDPFENTHSLAPLFPQSNRSQTAGRVEVDPPVPSPSGSGKATSAQGQTLTGQADFVSGAKAGLLLVPKKISSPNSHQEKHSEASFTGNAIRGVPIAGNGAAELFPNDGAGMVRQQQFSISTNHQSGVLPWKTRWVRRYVSDFGVPANTDTAKAARVGDSGPTRWLSPRDGLVPVTTKTPSPAGVKPGSSPVPNKRSPWRRQPQAPRLIIGQLTVDVVPAKPDRMPKSRKRPLRKSSHDRPGKLTRAETARFGFGIGQM